MVFQNISTPTQPKRLTRYAKLTRPSRWTVQQAKSFSQGLKINIRGQGEMDGEEVLMDCGWMRASHG